MISSPKFRDYHLKILLYLEWSLLAIIFLSEAVSFWYFNLPRFPLLNFICLIIFAIMGLINFSNKPIIKFLVYLTEIILIVLASWLGGIRFFPLLYLVFVIRHCLLGRHRDRFIISISGFGFFLVTIIARSKAINISEITVQKNNLIVFLIIVSLFFAIIVLFLQLLIDAVLSEKESREKLEIANKKLQEYALQIEDIAILQERNRIAREIHDSLGHSLTALNLHLEAGLKILPSNPQEAGELLLDAKQLVKDALKEVRQSVSSLRSDPLEGKSLEKAIATLITEFQRSTAIIPNANINITRPIPSQIKFACYRIIQEALTNISKYAQATEVEIQLQTNTELELKVEDNGKGFNLNDNTSGFGLQGMKERTQEEGGKINITASPGHGCEIVVTFPL